MGKLKKRHARRHGKPSKKEHPSRKGERNERKKRHKKIVFRREKENKY